MGVCVEAAILLSVRHDILTAVSISVMVFGDMKPCTFVDIY